eukprot:46858-Amorphochlora_amoeboformis.AAC.1
MGLGACILFTLLPFVGTVVATAVLWDFLDSFGNTFAPKLDGISSENIVSWTYHSGNSIKGWNYVIFVLIIRGCTGRPLDGVLMTFASWVNRATH